jgi:hypothetical protein
MSTGGYEYQSEFARKYVAQGQAEGEARGEAKGQARAILSVLKARGLDVPREVEERVARCADLAELDQWLQRAVVVRAAEEIFG